MSPRGIPFNKMEESILNRKDKIKSDFVFGDEHKVSICIKDNNIITINSAGAEKFNMYIAYPSPCAATCLSAQIYSPALDQACLSIVKHLTVRLKRPILLAAS